METRRIPIGISDYKKMIDEGYYYVDKTDFIRQIIEEGALITLLPRPRRFGKTLNLSMLRYFFEKTDGSVFRPLFDGSVSGSGRISISIKVIPCDHVDVEGLQGGYVRGHVGQDRL